MNAFEEIGKVIDSWEGSKPSETWVDHKYRVYFIDKGFEANKEAIEELKNGKLKKYWVSSESSKQMDTHTFLIDPKKEKYLRVSDFCKKYKTSRQLVYFSKDKYDWLIESQNIRYIKPKEEC